MGKTIGTFDYTIEKMKPDDRPFNPVVHICLQNWSPGSGNVPRVSPELMTEGEIDEQVNALKADLDNVGRKAKAALVRAKESNQKIIAGGN